MQDKLQLLEKKYILIINIISLMHSFQSVVFKVSQRERERERERCCWWKMLYLLYVCINHYIQNTNTRCNKNKRFKHPPFTGITGMKAKGGKVPGECVGKG